ncbi:MAG: non-homologous end-joining DNA ligase [Syntrophomonadaceae bacterium]|nr:non-homologous end-joining DNA ligase [Syntrophomonadaceae bacterium]
MEFLKDFRAPMEPLSCTKLLPDSNYLYQVKWDGIRLIAIINKGKVNLINKHLRERNNQYAELHDLPAIIKAKTAVLDGEIVVLKDGKPSFPSVMKRDSCINEKQVEQLQKSRPINYMVFDLLFLNGENLMYMPLSQRQKYMAKIIAEKDYLHLVENFSDGKALFDVVESSGMEGVIAKRHDSPYIQGKKHQAWFKIKCLRMQNCLLGGYTLKGKRVNSLLLGAYRDDSFFYIGKAANGLDSECQDILSQQLPVLETTKCPFANLSSSSSNIHFIEPYLGVMVEYLEWTENLKLRFPVIKQFAVLKQTECVF